MGLFDWFRKPKPLEPKRAEPASESAVSLPQLCYDVAYFILPHYAFRDLAKLTDLCLNVPNAAGPFYYIMAAQSRGMEPDVEDAKRFRWHHGQRDGSEYFALEYPVPPPIDMSNIGFEQVMDSKVPFVLAPHYSAIIRSGSDVQYFVLGQAPIGGGTTLRAVLPEGANCNLGRGPQPELEQFLQAIRQRMKGGEPGPRG